MRRADRGSILVMAMWALMILATFALSISFGVQQRAALLSRLQTLDALYPLAYSGVEYAKSIVQMDEDKDIDKRSDIWATVCPQGTKITLAGGWFTIGDSRRSGLVDEESKINLNKTRPEVLLRLAQRVSGLEKDAAEDLTFCLLDWMDSDSFFGHPDYGAEDSDYESLERPYSAKDSDYEVLHEMLLVQGMNEDIFNALKPHVTVYGLGHVNLNTASREVLLALGFNEPTAAAILNYRAGADKTEGTGDDLYFLSLSSIPQALETSSGVAMDLAQKIMLDGLIASGQVGLSSSVFSAHIRAELERNGAAVEVDAVVDRNGLVKLARASEVQWPNRR